MFSGWFGRFRKREPPVEPEPKPESPSLPTGAERRRYPRVRVMSFLHGYGVELDVEVTVREASLGGFSIESRIPFPVGSAHTFLFTTAGGTETMVRCQCRHSRLTGSKGAAACIAGFEFLPQPQENLQIIYEILERLQAKT